jgi:hypothetical protein
VRARAPGVIALQEEELAGQGDEAFKRKFGKGGGGGDKNKKTVREL